MSPRVRSLLVVLVGGAALVFAADTVVRTPGFLVPRDFLEYWAAGRVNVRGGNPYHPNELLAEQKLADPDRDGAVMMWNPPPALAVYMPLGLLPPRWATLLWVGLQLAAVFIACDWLWRTYCPHHRWFAVSVAISFAGTAWLVSYGQNTGFMLLGLAGFLHFRQKEKPLAAGAFAALTALKPHLLACFGVLLLADAITRRGAKSLASGVAVIALALVVALVANPNAITQFIDAARHPAEGATPLPAWALPVPSYWLRMAIAPDQFWVQFVPCVLACVGFVGYRVWKGANWNWSREMPLVVAVSFLTTPYGGWLFDLPILLVPVVWAAARLTASQRWHLLVVFLVGQGAITLVSFAWPKILGRPVGMHEYWWVAPAALALCLIALGKRAAADQRG